MLTEMHEMFDTLIKLRTGKFYMEYQDLDASDQVDDANLYPESD